jgi:hypothetical protein
MYGRITLATRQTAGQTARVGGDDRVLIVTGCFSSSFDKDEAALRE